MTQDDSKLAIPDNRDPEVSAAMVNTLLEAARRLGVNDAPDLLARAGIDPAQVAEADSRIPFSRQEALWELVVEASGDPCFGLNMGIQSQLADLSLLGYIGASCATLGQALDSLELYQNLLGEGGALRIERSAGQTRIFYDPVHPRLPITWHRVCWVMATNVSSGRWLVGADFSPSELRFAAPEPPDSPRAQADLEAFFLCPVSFGAGRNTLVYDSAADDIPLPHASHATLKLMKQRADALLEQLGAADSTAVAVAGPVVGPAGEWRA